MKKRQYPGVGAGLAFAPCTIARAPSTEPAAAAARAGENGDELYEMTLSSEYEVERGWSDFRWREVLDHGADAVQLARLKSGRAPFLADHDGRRVIGVLSDPRLRDGALRVSVRFSKSALAQEIRRDVDDGIRQNTSVGYVPKRVKLVEEDQKKGDLWRVSLWEPLEGSSVAIPADPSVGFNRSAEGAITQLPVVVEESTQEVRTMDPKDKNNPAGEPGGEGGEEEGAVEVGPAEQHAKIIRMCERNGCVHKAAEFIEKGLSEGQVALELLELVRTRGPAIKSGDPLKEVPARDRRRYSYARAIHIAAGMRDGSAKFDGLEAQIHREIEGQLPKNYQARGGVMVPVDLRSPDEAWQERLQKRTLDSKSLGKGSELLFETPGELIDILRNQSACVALGAQTLTGLTGPVSFPRQTSGMAFSWVPENPSSDVTSSDLGLGLVILQGKTLQGTTAYARQLLIQASIDVETMVRNEIGKGHGLAVDRAGIHGKGADGQPTGIYLAPDVQPKSMGGTPTYAQLVDMIGLVADKNATMGSLGWVTTALMASKFLQTLMFSAAGSDTIWQGTLEVGGTGRLAGYRAIASNQVSKTMSGSADTGGSEHGIIFGNWADMLIGLFAGLEIVVDPYAQKKRGLIEVTSFQMADIVLRHGESFAKSTGAT